MDTARDPDAAPKPEPARAPYEPPRVTRFGLVATQTAVVGKTGQMDGFKGFRTS